ncbi:hypothetical protein BDV96DRAFT_223149 [Lophiotrema nucula]|uniref:Uncharacterized protein n=1 Tax=Lophiotrema nucula TaxID=690887 RepID=A0A6A5YSP5_9PLEO|nr:hypothetical protein BDV96DRAFT_223149 [Lophiotrema nucula]
MMAIHSNSVQLHSLPGLLPMEQSTPLKATITIADPETATTFACSLSTHRPHPNHLVLWVHGSPSQPPSYEKPSGAGIAFFAPQTGAWKEYVSISLTSTGTAEEAGLLAISSGFNKVIPWRKAYKRVDMFTSCLGVLEGLRVVGGALHGLRFLDKVNEQVSLLAASDIEVNLHWVPAAPEYPLAARQRVSVLAETALDAANHVWVKEYMFCEAARNAISLKFKSWEKTREWIVKAMNDGMARQAGTVRERKVQKMQGRIERRQEGRRKKVERRVKLEGKALQETFGQLTLEDLGVVEEEMMEG